MNFHGHDVSLLGAIDVRATTQNTVGERPVKPRAFSIQPDFVADEMVKKLILLFIMEKMEFPLTDESLNEIISHNSDWMNYMDFREALYLLIESKFIYQIVKGADTCFNITADGRGALGHFYQKIPASIREEITEFAKVNRQKFKRRQEYTYDYYKNADGTYTVVLQIQSQAAGDNVLEIKFKTDTRATAKSVAAKWREKAAAIYETIYLLTTDEDDDTIIKGEKPQ